MKIYEIGTGYTSIPAKMGAATEIVVEELTRAFISKGVSAEIIDIQDKSRPETDLPITEIALPGFFSKTDLHLGILHKAKRVIYSIALARKLRKILKDTTSKTVLHFHNQYNLFFFLKLTTAHLRSKCTIVYTNHSGIWRLPWNEIASIIRKRYFQEAECMKRADIVFALNEETISNAVQHLGIPKSKFRIMQNGVNTKVYCPLNDAEKTAIMKAYNLEGKHVILQVGSIYENKGQARSLALLAPLLRCRSDLIYAYAGGIVSEEYHEKVKTIAKQMNLDHQVCYLGILSPGKELNHLYNIADATIFASRYEAFSLVIIESLSAGTPVLLESKAPFSLGKGCLQYSSENICSLVNNLLLNDSYRNSVSHDARENAIKNYSWDHIAERHLSAFE